MFDEEKQPVRVTSFPRGTLLLNRLMQELFVQLQESICLRSKLFEVRFLTTSIDQAVVVLLYKVPLTDAWKAEATRLAKVLKVKVIGRARKMKFVASGIIIAPTVSTASSSNADTTIIEGTSGIYSNRNEASVNSTSTGEDDSDAEAEADGDFLEDGDESVREVLTVGDRSFIYYQTEGAFSQPNARVCEKMLQFAIEASQGALQEDLLELYCGGGTFTIALAHCYRNVLATEMSKMSVQLGKKAIQENGITNIKIARLSSEEFTEAYSQTRSFQRLQDSDIDLSTYNLTTVLVDPPRAGLDKSTCQLISRFDKIIYISCNPVTLARDLEVLTATHSIARLAAFDQFPYTDHLECGVFLVKNKDVVDDHNSASILGKRPIEEDPIA